MQYVGLCVYKPQSGTKLMCINLGFTANTRA